MGKFKASIGLTNATNNQYLTDEQEVEDKDQVHVTDDETSVCSDQLIETIFEVAREGSLDLDEIMVSVAHADKPKGIDADHLCKVWKIDLEAAKKTIEITSQNSTRQDNPKLSRNYGTNDRMLRYKRIKDYFFMDASFATKKSGKSSRGNSCCQLFVTDKGFV